MLNMLNSSRRSIFSIPESWGPAAAEPPARGSRRAPQQPSVAVTPKLVRQAVQLKRSQEVQAARSMPDDVASAFERMRSRKFALNLLNGMGCTKAAAAAEADARASLAVLAQQRGGTAVDKATFSRGRRDSCAGRLLKRQSMQAVISSEKQEDVSESCETGVGPTSPAPVHRRLRKRVSCDGDTKLMAVVEEPDSHVPASDDEDLGDFSTQHLHEIGLAEGDSRERRSSKRRRVFVEGPIEACLGA